MNCVFCKILNNEIPSHRVYEDAHTLAFLDIFPFAKGHTLVIPRVHVATLADLPQDELARLIAGVQRVGSLVMRGMGCDGFNVMQNNGAAAGQTIPHVHFHIIPRYDGVPIAWKPHKDLYATGEAEAVAAKIRGAL